MTYTLLSDSELDMHLALRSWQLERWRMQRVELQCSCHRCAGCRPAKRCQVVGVHTCMPAGHLQERRQNTSIGLR